MKKFIIKLISIILIAVLPFMIFPVYVEGLENPYKETYLAAIFDQYERLNDADGKKITFVGGSSLPFGLRSDLIEEDFGGDYEVKDFGLYATLGTKFMLDLSKGSINQGDVVVISPELNAQTYSLYFNPQAVLEALDGLSSLTKYLSIKDNLSLLYNYYKFAFKKISYVRNGDFPTPTDIYSRSSLNGYGDVSVDRPYNVMNNGYDSNMLITLDDQLLNKEFIDYVNDYIEYAENKGATVLFNYSPLNRAAIRTSKVARAEFEEKLKQMIDCPLLGNIEDYVIDERYFYDTNFHLNSAGAIHFSKVLSLNLKDKLGMPLETFIESPTPPDIPDDTVTVDPSDTPVDFDEYKGEPNIDYVDYFEYELVGSTYTITGVKDEYIGVKEVILPSVYNGKNVTAVSSNAFYGCAELEYIHIGNTYKELAARSFNGCISLKGVYLYQTEGNKILPPSQGLMDGTAESVKIYIPEGANYSTGYVWSNYESRFVTFDR